MSVDDNSEPDGFYENILIPDYRRLSSQKGVFIYFFWPFLFNGAKDFPNFLHDCRGVHCLS